MDALLRSAGLAKLVEDLDKFVKNDATLRLIQASNEAQNVKSWYGNSAAGSQLSDTTPFQPLADPNFSAYDYAYLLLITDEASGKARYTIDGTPPKADATVGAPVYSGGSAVPITGSQNIRNFQVIAETGQTVNYALLLFR